MAEAQKSETSVYALSAASPPFDTQRAWAADLVLEQLECHRVANRKGIERRAFVDVAAVEKHLAAVRQPDEPVALADEQRDDAS